MIFELHNWNLNVGNVEIGGISASSVFLIGDNDEMILSSFYDTPPESFTIGNIVPLSSTV
ncbi:spore gernimation protein GerPD [Oceanobacillus bengalensis]|uniref:Spore gernimation protein GerPD n=1 Tax=Oceanobacillus bengalensis TaxID=1435466 RepID=A0A494Z898_9BACI|nr:spore gernimation protein GerPD [Oceanobacillus bengalensis]RKQ18832.1 spore gernimation protein GerPD [Oceanobacillus bengalensis]